MMKIRCLGILVCLLAAGSLFAAGGNANLQPLAGSWTCTGVAFASDMGPEHPTKATVTSAWILSDKWLRVDYKEMKTAKNPHPIAAEMLMTYNEPEKKIASGCLDNMGGYCTEEAPGWDGDKLELSGQGNFGGHSMKVRDTFTKGKGWIKHMGEVEMDGKWMKLDEETCKK
jgi:hypothetical protein